MLTKLYCNCENVITITDTTNPTSTDLVVTWTLSTTDGTQLTGGTGTATSQGAGVYTFNISKTVAELMTRGTFYVLDLDDNATGFGQTFKVRAEWHQG